MNDLLQTSAGSIGKWLETKLPALSANWWFEHVINRLTFQQQLLAKNRSINSMGGLDLAAVLRVLDQNWNELAAVNSLPREARNWVKELQSARNRWAHAPVGGVEPRDAFRDADTLERLLAVVDADPELMNKLSLFKAKTLTRLALGND